MANDTVTQCSYTYIVFVSRSSPLQPTTFPRATKETQKNHKLIDFILNCLHLSFNFKVKFIISIQINMYHDMTFFAEN